MIAAEVGRHVTLDGRPDGRRAHRAGRARSTAVTYESRRCAVSAGVHRLSGDKPFGIVAYGYGAAGSYAVRRRGRREARLRPAADQVATNQRGDSSSTMERSSSRIVAASLFSAYVGELTVIITGCSPSSPSIVARTNVHWSATVRHHTACAPPEAAPRGCAKRRRGARPEVERWGRALRRPASPRRRGSTGRRRSPRCPSRRAPRRPHLAVRPSRATPRGSRPRTRRISSRSAITSSG